MSRGIEHDPSIQEKHDIRLTGSNRKRADPYNTLNKCFELGLRVLNPFNQFDLFITTVVSTCLRHDQYMASLND